MDIQDFLPNLKEFTDFGAGTNNLSQFSGETIGVDVSVWVQNCINSKVQADGLLRDFNALPQHSVSAHYFCVDQNTCFNDLLSLSLTLVLVSQQL